MSDLIKVSGIEVWARHGVFDEEKQSGQRFVVDLTVGLDLAEATRADDLTKTVDYGDLAQRTHDLVSGTRFDLIETVAQEIASMVLEDPRIGSVAVTVHKPDAPIGVPFRDVSVTIERHR